MLVIAATVVALDSSLVGTACDLLQSTSFQMTKLLD